MGQLTHTTAEQKNSPQQTKRSSDVWAKEKKTSWTDIITANYNN